MMGTPSRQPTPGGTVAERQPRKKPGGNRQSTSGSSQRRGQGRPTSLGAGKGERREFSRPRRDDGRSRERSPRSEEQQRYDGPPIPEDITGRELDRNLASQLKSLPEKLANRVARHLVAADRFIEADPKLAYQHTLAARARAGRLAVVREAVGEAAYAAGEYAEALAELRAAKRMNGAHDYVAIMADCERALKRPDRALRLIQNAPKDALASPLRAELTIVEAGARRDRGELDAALRTLENAPLMSSSRKPWVARLRYASADALVEADRLAEALTWFHRAEAVDSSQATDAGERAAAIERRLA
jgi:tetratricopeptide (TPR) repeat protein